MSQLTSKDLRENAITIDESFFSQSDSDVQFLFLIHICFFILFSNDLNYF